MARLAISKDYFPAYAALPRKAQRKADEFLRKFEQDSTALSIHLEPIKRALDPMLRSARIGDDYRMILRAPEQGDVFLVLWADHHDEAYRWAGTKQTAVHPATGSLQIFDVTAASAALTTAPAPPSPAPPPSVVPESSPELPSDLFDAHSDDDLFIAGVPRALLPSVRAIGSDADLDRLLPHLPPEAGEVLTALAAGISLDEALEEVLGRVAPPAAAPAPPVVDVTDVPAALARDTTQRQFRLLEEGLDLDAALKHPLDVWRVFLHPRQRRIAHAHTKGPTRVLGGAGTGKTVVALHRAAFLVREVYKKPDDRVLFTTFTVNLAHDLRAQLGKILEPDDLARVEVVNIDAWASSYLRGRGISVRPAFDEEQREHFDAAYEVYGKDDVPVDFYRAEWRDVIQEQGLGTEDEYVRAVRKSRGVPLGRSDRRRLWPVFAAYRDNLEHAGMLEPIDILRRARSELEAAAAPPRYRSLVVDETQDFSAEGLRLLRAIVGPEHPDDLFLVGDAHQRIYGKPIALSHCGIQVRGRRSQTLRLNYRTTGAICRWSLGILKDVSVDDLDEGKADGRGYVSLREGPAPTIHGSSSTRDEEAAIVETLKAYLDAGTAAESICVVARTIHVLRDRFALAFERAGVPYVILEREEPRLPGVRLATMHRVKGLEFAVVLVGGVSKLDVPLSTPELRSEDPVMSAHALLRERSLLYVAASRARDDLHVFYAGEPSTFLAAIPASAAKPAPAQAALVPPPSPQPTEEATTPLEQVLAAKLDSLRLPTRMATYCEREGLATVGDLARRAPEDLLAERNLGRKSIQDTRRVLEHATGRSWEELAAPRASDAADEAPKSTTVEFAERTDWELLRVSLTEAEEAIPLSQIELPARLRTFSQREGIVTLGDLATRSRADLTAIPNLGRRTVGDLPGAIARHLDVVRAEVASERAGSGEEEPLLDSFKSAIEGLDAMMRIIATRRSGLGGDSMTLQELGEMFGVSRERIRQLETKVCDQLRRQSWSRRADRRTKAAIEHGPVPLASLVGDRWWADACERPAVIEFVLDSILASDVRVIELDGEKWLSRHRSDVLADAWSSLLRAVEGVELPAPVRRMESLVEEAAGPFGAHVAKRFRDDVRQRMQIDPSDEGRVLALGGSQAAEILAMLRTSAEPMRREEIERRLGIERLARLPEEVIHFDRGTVGLRQHFPDFDGWRARLLPPVVALIAELGPDRQWHCGEILDELREAHDIPTWLTPYALGALIRVDERLRYLGRLRVALPGSRDNESRVYVHEAVEALLEDAGEPVTKTDLLHSLGKRLGASDIGIAQVFARPQFVRIDEERIGLLARDVPGGAAAIAEASDHVEAVLARRDRGLSDFHAHEEVRGLSTEHASWSVPLTVSVLRSDGRFRFNQSGAIGLATWDSTRVPTRLELIRAAIDESGGRVSIEAVLARIEAHYGERSTRNTLVNLAGTIGASVEGDWIVHARSAGMNR